MHKSLLVLLFLLFQQVAFSQPGYQSRVFIELDATHKIADLAALGLDVEHGQYAPHKHLIGDFSKSEIEQLEAAGFSVRILIENVTDYYATQAAASEADTRNLDCDPTNDVQYDYPTPENFELGSMGGYLTYQEMLDNLDSMYQKYPEIITPRTEIPDILTHDGYPIYWVRISDNAAIDESEPEMIYTALHHAREPGSLSQMIFYMWHLLENYSSDPEAAYLLDHTELYFVPCLNPDGYLYNEFTNPDGGGFWRKNRRDNLDGSFGVDLNRNYGFGWGWDDQGSSPNPSSAVYRGPEAFSEPETQAIRDLCNAHEFQIALNYHTYGNLLIYPWGYLDALPVDGYIFEGMTQAMNRENSFLAGTATETVGYTVNGVSDDWMYGETMSKPPIYSITPEVGPGSFGFWPPESYIDQLCKSTLLQNLTAAHMLLVYGIADDNSPEEFTETEGQIDYTLTRYGLQEGTLTVSLTALSDNILSVSGTPQSYMDLEYGENIDNSFGFEIDPNAGFGEELLFLLAVDNGTFVQSDTLRKTYFGGMIETVFSTDASDFANWITNGNWDLTTENFYSSPTSITDSPGSFYSNNQISELRSPVIDLVGLDNATLQFWATWDIEDSYDYVHIEAVDQFTGAATTLCGLYTNPGSGFFQPEGLPLYDGTQQGWVQEKICLDDFVGTEIRIALTLYSDGGVIGDGFYLDDMEVTTTLEDTTTTTSTLGVEPDSQNLLLYPNPATEFIWAQWQPTDPGQTHEIRVYDQLGRLLIQETSGGSQVRLDVQSLPEGLYFIEVDSDAGDRSSGHFIRKRS